MAAVGGRGNIPPVGGIEMSLAGVLVPWPLKPQSHMQSKSNAGQPMSWPLRHACQSLRT